ncbi:MAG: hypothetical protein KDC19_14945, partial [Saprospiraceae bacterium]|nr:hypothetical protein [Saprospiraceae bacterium]
LFVLAKSTPAGAQVGKNRCRQNGPSYSCLAYHSSRLSACSMPTSGPGRSYLIGGRIPHQLCRISNLDQDSDPLSDQIMRPFLRLINILWFNLHFMLDIRVSDVFGRPWFDDDPFK